MEASDIEKLSLMPNAKKKEEDRIKTLQNIDICPFPSCKKNIKKGTVCTHAFGHAFYTPDLILKDLEKKKEEFRRVAMDISLIQRLLIYKYDQNHLFSKEDLEKYSFLKREIRDISFSIFE